MFNLFIAVAFTLTSATDVRCDEFCYMRSLKPSECPHRNGRNHNIHSCVHHPWETEWKAGDLCEADHSSLKDLDNCNGKFDMMIKECSFRFNEHCVPESALRITETENRNRWFTGSRAGVSCGSMILGDTSQSPWNDNKDEFYFSSLEELQWTFDFTNTDSAEVFDVTLETFSTITPAWQRDFDYVLFNGRKQRWEEFAFSKRLLSDQLYKLSIHSSAAVKYSLHTTCHLVKDGREHKTIMDVVDRFSAFINVIGSLHSSEKCSKPVIADGDSLIFRGEKSHGSSTRRRFHRAAVQLAKDVAKNMFECFLEVKSGMGTKMECAMRAAALIGVGKAVKRALDQMKDDRMYDMESCEIYYRTKKLVDIAGEVYGIADDIAALEALEGCIAGNSFACFSVVYYGYDLGQQLQALIKDVARPLLTTADPNAAIYKCGALMAREEESAMDGGVAIMEMAREEESAMDAGVALAGGLLGLMGVPPGITVDDFQSTVENVGFIGRTIKSCIQAAIAEVNGGRRRLLELPEK